MGTEERRSSGREGARPCTGDLEAFWDLVVQDLGDLGSLERGWAGLDLLGFGPGHQFDSAFGWVVVLPAGLASGAAVLAWWGGCIESGEGAGGPDHCTGPEGCYILLVQFRIIRSPWDQEGGLWNPGGRSS